MGLPRRCAQAGSGRGAGRSSWVATVIPRAPGRRRGRSERVALEKDLLSVASGLQGLARERSDRGPPRRSGPQARAKAERPRAAGPG